MAASVMFSEVLFGSDAEAIRALRSVGCELDGDLTMEVDYPDFGRVRRLFGVFQNCLQTRGRVENPIIADRMLRILDDPDNSYIYDKLEEGRLSHTPFNKQIIRRVLTDLGPLKLHAPWAFKMMNFDFGMRLASLHKQRGGLEFAAFYSQMIQATPEDGDVKVDLVRLFSLPIGGTAQGTWHQTISEDMLDEDVALVLEANVRG